MKRYRAEVGLTSQTHKGAGMVMKRTENGCSQRRHGVLKILVIFLAIIAIFGPTVLVISDAWAKGGGGAAGSGGSPGSSGNGGGNGGGSGSSNGSGGSGGAGNSGTAGGNGNGG